MIFIVVDCRNRGQAADLANDLAAMRRARVDRVMVVLASSALPTATAHCAMDESRPEQ